MITTSPLFTQDSNDNDCSRNNNIPTPFVLNPPPNDDSNISSSVTDDPRAINTTGA